MLSIISQWRNEKKKKKHKEICPIYPLDRLKFKNHHCYRKKKKIYIYDHANPSEDVNQLQLLYTFGRNAITTLGKIMEIFDKSLQFFKKFNMFLPSHLVILQLVIYPAENKYPCRDYMQIFFASLFVIAENWGKSKYILTIE